MFGLYRNTRGRITFVIGFINDEVLPEDAANTLLTSIRLYRDEDTIFGKNDMDEESLVLDIVKCTCERHANDSGRASESSWPVSPAEGSDQQMDYTLADEDLLQLVSIAANRPWGNRKTDNTETVSVSLKYLFIASVSEVTTRTTLRGSNMANG